MCLYSILWYFQNPNRKCSESTNLDFKSPIAVVVIKQTIFIPLIDNGYMTMPNISEHEVTSLTCRVRMLVGDRSITDFARVLDLNHESVRRYIRRKTAPPAVFLLRIADRIDVDADWLLTGRSRPDGVDLSDINTNQLVAELQRRSKLSVDTNQSCPSSNSTNNQFFPQSRAS